MNPALVYDEDRARLVLFGGATSCSNRSGDDETWEYDGTNWQRVITLHSPPPRYNAVMAYDSYRKRVVMFGGTDSQQGLGDTWEYDGVDWYEVLISSPGGCSRPSMAYDPVSRKVVQRRQRNEGGDGQCSSPQTTWEYDGAAWQLIQTPTQPPDQQHQDWHAPLVWDDAHQRMLYLLVDAIWSYDGTSWNYVESFACGVQGMGVDSGRGVVVLSGVSGSDQPRSYNPTVEWRDGECGTSLTHAVAPPPRSAAYTPAIYFAARGSLIAFGGYDYCSSNTYNDTWEYRLDTDSDGFADTVDCASADGTVYPGAPAVCDGKNNDCSDPAWPSLPPDEADADQDGYGACGPDCDDADPLRHPNAPELCDAIDNDCDQTVDEDGSGIDTDADGVRNACDNCVGRFNPDQLNVDGDRAGNACDNCLTVPNDDQVDLDSDSQGNACDNCVASYNPLQADVDADSIGDICDNCLTTRNESQHDFDSDNEGDECDLNDGIVIFRRIDRPRVRWQSDPAFTSYSLYRGSLAVLLAGGPYTQPPGSNPYAGRFCGLSGTFQDDSVTPSAGDAVYWLVAGKGIAGEAALGSGDSVTRSNANPCP